MDEPAGRSRKVKQLAASASTLLRPENRVPLFFKENRTAFYRAAKDLPPDERAGLEQELVDIFSSSIEKSDVRVDTFKAWCELQLARLSIKPDDVKRRHDSWSSKIGRLGDIATGPARRGRDTYNAEPGRPELAAAAANLVAMRKELVLTSQGDPTRQQMLAILKACMATAADRKLLSEADLQGLNYLAGLPNELHHSIAGFADDQTLLTLAAIDKHWADEIAREQLCLRPDASRDASAQVLLGQQSQGDVASAFSRFPHVSIPQQRPRGITPEAEWYSGLYGRIARLSKEELAGLRSLQMNVPFRAVRRPSREDTRMSASHDEVIRALRNVSQCGPDHLTISMSVEAERFAPEYLRHMPQLLSPGSKVDSVDLGGGGDGTAHEGALAAALQTPGNRVRRVNLSTTINIVGNELMAAARDLNNRIESLSIFASRVHPAELAQTLESPNNHLRTLSIGIELGDRKDVEALGRALQHRNCKLDDLDLNLRSSYRLPMDNAMAVALGDALKRAVERPDGPTTLMLGDMPRGEIGAQISRRILKGLASGNSTTQTLSVSSQEPPFDVRPFIEAMENSRLSVEKLAFCQLWGARIHGMPEDDQLRLIRAAVDSVKKGAPLKVLDLSWCPRRSGAGDQRAQAMLDELADTGRTLKLI